MQIMLNIPDEIPQEMINKMLWQFEKQIHAVKKSVLKSLPANDDVSQTKARQDLTQMVYKLRESATEIGFVSEEEISQWVNEAREKHASHY